MARQIQLVKIEAQLQWQARRAHGGNWVAVCEPLKLTFQAESWANLMEDIALGIDAMLKDLLSTNELDRFLRDRGWNAIGPLPTQVSGVRFDVPFHVAQAAEGHGSQRRVH
jgi:predicted RNase H-like HicB family nuclease